MLLLLLLLAAAVRLSRAMTTSDSCCVVVVAALCDLRTLRYSLWDARCVLRPYAHRAAAAACLRDCVEVVRAESVEWTVWSQRCRPSDHRRIASRQLDGSIHALLCSALLCGSIVELTAPSTLAIDAAPIRLQSRLLAVQ